MADNTLEVLALLGIPALRLNSKFVIKAFNPAIKNLTNKTDALINSNFKKICQKLHITLPPSFYKTENIPQKQELTVKQNNIHSNKAFTITIIKHTSNDFIATIKQIEKVDNDTEAQYLRYIVDSLPENIYWSDLSGKCLGCNKQLLANHGLNSFDEYVGKTFYEKYEEKEIKHIKKIYEKIIRTGKSIILEEHALKNGKKAKTYLSHKKPLRDANNKIIGIIGISFDITKRKLLEKTLIKAKKRAENAEKTLHSLLTFMTQEITGQKTNREKNSIKLINDIKNYFENIIALMPGNVYWMNTDGINLGCNDNVLRMHGLSSRKEYIGKHYKNFFDPPEFKSIKKIDDEVIKTGETKILEEKAIKNGKLIATYLTHKVPLKNNSGKVIGLLGISIDITERKKAQQKLQETEVHKKLLEEKMQAMKSIAASIAHELRTPLRSISNNTGAKKYLTHLLQAYEQAKQAGLPIEKIRPSILAGLTQAMDGIRRETKYANNFIDMLLTNIKELDAENKATKHKIHSIAECINEALRRFPFSPVDKANLVEWKSRADFMFKGEPLLIIHILFNLLKNALYFLEKAGKGSIKISLRKTSKYNKLIFRDTGTGIPEQALPHIFDHFYTTSSNGTGIGLTFCKMTMRNIGGDITCKSVEGEFTEFTLLFPVVKT